MVTLDKRTIEPVGRVEALYRYPVKSMRGEAISEIDLTWHGFAGDRRFAFVRSDYPSGFPWLTARQIPAMLTYVACFTDPARPDDSHISVKIAGQEEMALESPELQEMMASQYGGPVHLMKLDRGTFDESAVSLISLSTVEALTRPAGLNADPRRFRPNIVVSTPGVEPFQEDDWVGGLLVFGDDPRLDVRACVHVSEKDPRCMMINLDPDTAKQTPSVLRSVVAGREKCAGIYGSTQSIGTLRLGDAVYLLPKM